MTCVYDAMKYAYDAIYQTAVGREYMGQTAQRRSRKAESGAADQLELGSWTEKKMPAQGDNDVSPQELPPAPTLAHLEEVPTAPA